MRYGQSTFVVRGKDRFDIGTRAAQASGAKTLAIVRALSRWSRAYPLLAAGSLRAPASALEEVVLSEARGASAALGIATDDLLVAQRLFRTLVQPACTNFGAVGDATEDGSSMLSWNLDLPPYFRPMLGRFPLFVRDLDGTIPYVCMGVPALMAIGVMNAEGLGCVVNAVGLTDAGVGLSAYELNNKAMETCSTVDEAAKVYSDGPRGSIEARTVGLLMNFNTIWTDRERNLSVFEYSHNHFHREDATARGAVASANHHQFLSRDLSGSFDPSTQELISGSYSRLARMYALLEEFRGRLNPLIAKRIVSDHIPDYSVLRQYGIDREWWQQKVDDSTICAHAWNFKKHMMRGEIGDAFLEMGFSSTLYTMQFQPESMTSWFTRGHPCRNDAVPVYWGNLLGSTAERYPGAGEPHEMFTSRRQTRLHSIFHSGRGGYEGLLGRTWNWLIRTIENQAK